jgi:alkaline phosphatase
VLERSGEVLAVLQGHSHDNSLATLGGIPYCVVRAMVEDEGARNNAFASVDVFADHSLVLRGSFRQSSYPVLGAGRGPTGPVVP